MEEANISKDPRFIGMERKSVFPQWLRNIKHVTTSVYVIKRSDEQSIDQDGVIVKLKKHHVDKINHQFKNFQILS